MIPFDYTLKNVVSITSEEKNFRYEFSRVKKMSVSRKKKVGWLVMHKRNKGEIWEEDCLALSQDECHSNRRQAPRVQR